MPNEDKFSSNTVGVIERAATCLPLLDNVEVAFTQELSYRAGTYIDAGDLPLHPKILEFLRNHLKFQNSLFSHQYSGIHNVLKSLHTIVSTATSSGKSLIFSLPVLDALVRDPNATALLIYPQKALANDQLAKLKEMIIGVIGSSAHPLTVSRYDGATPDEQRPAIRDHARVIITNPDMLHRAILQYHPKWARFFKNLKFVAVDEAHNYRGIFGSSVAYIFRRLRAIVSMYDANAVFIAASATVDQPVEHMRRLTGLEFTEIGTDQDGSIQGRKKIWLLKTNGNFYQVGRTLTLALVEQGLSCLTFCPSRKMAESLLDDLPDSVRKDDRIRVYRAGLKNTEREETERGLADGSVRAVFATSALELGIDIGSLDAVVCVGLPNTMMSLWQRAGRVGRAGKEGAIFFIAADTPLDTYHVEHPEELFARDNEPLAVNLQNRRLVCHHLACAIDEAGDEKLLNFEAMGEAACHALELRRAGRLNAEIFYATEKHMQTPIRSSDGSNYKLMVNDDVIGEIDQWHLLREAYPHAIYLHGGRRFRVQDIFRSKREVRLVREKSRLRTVPVIRKSLRSRRVRSVAEYPGITITEADLDVTERLIAVQEKKPDGTTVGQFPGHQGLAPHRLPTEGIVLELKGDFLQSCDHVIGNLDRMSVYSAIERLIGSLFPVIAGPCDTMDYDTFCERRDGSVLMYLYDQVHDGIDLAVQAFNRIELLLEKSLDRVQSCDCGKSEGCFRCVKDPDVENITDKNACIGVLAKIIHHLKNNTAVTQTFNVDVLDEQPETFGNCPKCQQKVKPDARFCSACGEKLQET
jgi:DEAD/DEAH box helicase domain-containing protein